MFLVVFGKGSKTNNKKRKTKKEKRKKKRDVNKWEKMLQTIHAEIFFWRANHVWPIWIEIGRSSKQIIN